VRREDCICCSGEYMFIYIIVVVVVLERSVRREAAVILPLHSPQCQYATYA